MKSRVITTLEPGAYRACRAMRTMRGREVNLVTCGEPAVHQLVLSYTASLNGTQVARVRLTPLCRQHAIAKAERFRIPMPCRCGFAPAMSQRKRDLKRGSIRVFCMICQSATRLHVTADDAISDWNAYMSKDGRIETHA